MKWIQLILLVSYLQVRAGGNAQSITFSGKNVPLKTIFQEIKNQTGYTIFCNYSLLENAHDVSISVKNASVQETLRQALKNQNLDYSIQGTMIVITPKALQAVPADTASMAVLPAPDREITGEIVNEKQEPVADVSIELKGGHAGGSM